MDRNVLRCFVAGVLAASIASSWSAAADEENKPDKAEAKVPAKAAPADKAGPKEPATAPAAPDAGKVTVVSVSGSAQKFVAANGKKWLPLKAGDALAELTLIRTGFGAKVVLRFADRSEVVVNNGTKMGIGEFRTKGEQTKTRLGLKYGTIRASVDTSKGPQDFQVRTPVATLSVRGTPSTSATVLTLKLSCNCVILKS